MLAQKSKLQDQIKIIHGIEPDAKKKVAKKKQPVSTTWDKIKTLNDETELIREEIVNDLSNLE